MLKKLALTVAILASAAAAFAQGTVNFNNSVVFKTAADRNVYLGAVGTASGGTLLFGTKYKAQLYVGTDANSLSPITAAFSQFRSVTTSAGTWSGGGRDLVTASRTFQPQESMTLAVRVWDITTGATWETATARGSSNPFSYTAPAADAVDVTLFYMEGLRGFAVVPEPGTFALAGLGLLGLVMARRRK